MAYNVQLAAGRYTAQAISAGAYETPGGALMVGIQWELANPAHDTITSRTCLISKAGVVQEKAIAAIRKWAPGWDGVTMEWFGLNCPGIEVDLTIERRVDSYDGREKPEVAFIDPVGSKERSAIPAADQKALGAKFGAKLRALAGTMPKPVAPPPKAKPKTAGTAAHDPAAEKRTDAWNAFKDAFKGADGARDAAWFALVARAVPGKTDYGTFTVADWEAVNAAVAAETGADDLPF